MIFKLLRTHKNQQVLFFDQKGKTQFMTSNINVYL